jgi:ribosomal protein S18 acetylase RimI-like enzyme
MHIAPIHADARDRLLAIAEATGLFSPVEAEQMLGGVIDALTAGTLSPLDQALGAHVASDQEAVGWSYFAPDAHADGVWNIWWFGVHPEAHGSGVAQALLQAVEARIAAAGGRLVIIETSDAAGLLRARRFYAREGYAECGRVPDFYAEGESKVIFARRPRR